MGFPPALFPGLRAPTFSLSLSVPVFFPRNTVYYIYFLLTPCTRLVHLAWIVASDLPSDASPGALFQCNRIGREHTHRPDRDDALVGYPARTFLAEDRRLTDRPVQSGPTFTLLNFPLTTRPHHPPGPANSDIRAENPSKDEK